MSDTFTTPAPRPKPVPSHPAPASDEQVQREHQANYFGMWLFLASEIMFFGAIFTGYIVYYRAYPATFAEAAQYMDVVLGGINTFILLTSSLTMALAVHAAQVGKRNRLILFLLVTMLLGAIFLGIKGYEYFHKVEEHLFPGWQFMYSGQQPESLARVFFSMYFTMTGLHALHMVIGIGLMAVLVFMAWRRAITPQHYSPVELTGLFWHFVDIVWIFLYPLLYLIEH